MSTFGYKEPWIEAEEYYEMLENQSTEDKIACEMCYNRAYKDDLVDGRVCADCMEKLFVAHKDEIIKEILLNENFKRVDPSSETYLCEWCEEEHPIEDSFYGFCVCKDCIYDSLSDIEFDYMKQIQEIIFKEYI